jgi:hypothetical protein
MDTNSPQSFAFDPVTLAVSNQVRIFADLLCDVAVRYPGAFAVTAPVTALGINGTPPEDSLLRAVFFFLSSSVLYSRQMGASIYMFHRGTYNFTESDDLYV